MTMTTREKAAREVYGLAPAHHDPFHPLYCGRARTWEEAPMEHARCFASVDAVLRAIREPSEAAAKAAAEICVGHAWSSRGEHICASSAPAVFAAMIDSILNGEG